MRSKSLNIISTFTPKQLSQIKSTSTFILNTLLTNLTHSHTPQNALHLYNQILSHHHHHHHHHYRHNTAVINHYTFVHAIKACSILHTHHKCQEIHAHVIKTSHFSYILVQNTLTHFYVLDNDTISAVKVFDSIHYPDVVSWTTIISGLSKAGFQEDAIDRFCSMNVEPNDATLVSVLSACLKIRAVKYGKSIHCYSLKKMSERNIILENALLDFYVQCVSAEIAEHLFDNMRSRDVVSWTTIIGGLSGRGLCEKAMLVFREMVRKGDIKPNEATIVSVLASCSSAGVLNWGKWVHTYVNNQNDLKGNGNVGNALINMYVKCGDIGMALRVFEMLSYKDVVSWSSVISGLAMNGLGKHVLPIFALMLVHGVQPDDVVFLGLLSACSHGGMVVHGLIFFNAMSNLYGIVPRMQHYACVVDMYGRAGRLEEAEDFIRNMPLKADGIVWGALLNACKIHGNHEMFERISRCVVNAENVSVGTIALLSNTYASSRRWDEANRVRCLMRCSGLKKIAGSSCVEIDA